LVVVGTIVGLLATSFVVRNKEKRNKKRKIIIVGTNMRVLAIFFFLCNN
jgi:hypothetical protein